RPPGGRSGPPGSPPASPGSPRSPRSPPRPPCRTRPASATTWGPKRSWGRWHRGASSLLAARPAPAERAHGRPRRAASAPPMVLPALAPRVSALRRSRAGRPPALVDEPRGLPGPEGRPHGGGDGLHPPPRRDDDPGDPGGNRPDGAHPGVHRTGLRPLSSRARLVRRMIETSLTPGAGRRDDDGRDE